MTTHNPRPRRPGDAVIGAAAVVLVYVAVLAPLGPTALALVTAPFAATALVIALVVTALRRLPRCGAGRRGRRAKFPLTPPVAHRRGVR